MAITNLTQKQVEMLDTMWSLESLDELLAWQSGLCEADYKMSITLQDMLMAEYIDENLEELGLSEALEVISRVKFNLH